VLPSGALGKRGGGNDFRHRAAEGVDAPHLVRGPAGDKQPATIWSEHDLIGVFADRNLIDDLQLSGVDDHDPRTCPVAHIRQATAFSKLDVVGPASDLKDAAILFSRSHHLDRVVDRLNQETSSICFQAVEPLSLEIEAQATTKRFRIVARLEFLDFRKRELQRLRARLSDPRCLAAVEPEVVHAALKGL